MKDLEADYLDPYQRPAFSVANRFARFVWGVCYILLFRWSPRPFFAWRRFILRLFGAKIGDNCAIYPDVKLWAPWNLSCSDMVAIAGGVEIYNPSVIYFDSHAIASQGAYLCAATHLYNDSKFPLVSSSIRVGQYSWICARAIVLPGVVIGDGAVLGAGSVASKNLEAWCVYAGNPAVKIKSREVCSGKP